MPQSHCSDPGKLLNLTVSPGFILHPSSIWFCISSFKAAQRIAMEWYSSLGGFQRGKMVALKLLLDSKHQVFYFALSALEKA